MCICVHVFEGLFSLDLKKVGRVLARSAACITRSSFGCIPRQRNSMIFYKQLVSKLLSEIGLLSEVFRQHEARERFNYREERKRKESFVGSLFDSWSMPTAPP